MTRAPRSRSRGARWAAVALASIAVAVFVGGGCDLNPQPIPPGLEPDATTAFGPGQGGGGTSDGKENDASAGLDAGATPSGLDAGSDADTNTVGSGLDGGDGGDGASDAAADADAH